MKLTPFAQVGLHLSCFLMTNSVLAQQGMNAQQGGGQDPLSSLRDIALPDAIGWWPLAPGWWILIAMLCLATVYLSVYFIRKNKRNRYRQQALTEIIEIHSAYRTQGIGHSQCINALSALLKRCFRAAYPGEASRIAAVHGSAWFHQLNRYTVTDYFESELNQHIEALQFSAPVPPSEQTEHHMTQLFQLSLIHI